MVSKALRVMLALKANKDHKAQLDSKVLREMLVRRAQLDLKVVEALKVHRAKLDHRVQ